VLFKPCKASTAPFLNIFYFLRLQRSFSRRSAVF